MSGDSTDVGGLASAAGLGEGPEGKFAMSREIEPVRRSFCRHGSRTLT